ncbi:MAG: class I SAM-dependent methyltransferase [Candidatus Scalindua sp.]
MQFTERENVREQKFNHIWNEDLDEVFTDVAKYYDRANHVASFGLWNWLRREFLSTIDVSSGQKVLDVCAGTNAIGLALLNKQADLEVSAIDRNEAMQKVGQKFAIKQGKHIKSIIGDVHELPFPDNYFDIVTLQYASRHLHIMLVSKEIQRVLKPGGYFYHSDMLRPENRLIEFLYYTYLRASLTFTAFIFRSNSAALNCRDYFIKTLRMFYSANEFSQLLEQSGYQNISKKILLGGMIGFHKAMKTLN